MESVFLRSKRFHDCRFTTSKSPVSHVEGTWRCHIASPYRDHKHECQAVAYEDMMYYFLRRLHSAIHISEL
jgi:hypothetical protein